MFDSTKSVVEDRIWISGGRSDGGRVVRDFKVGDQLVRRPGEFRGDYCHFVVLDKIGQKGQIDMRKGVIYGM